MTVIKSIKDPDFLQTLSDARSSGKFHKSPEAWEDQLLYFFLPDRFSNGKEKGYKDINNNPVADGTTPLFEPEDRNNAARDEESKGRWLDAGTRFVGGTIRGATSKLGYLRRMGVTSVWMGPIFKQVYEQETYHGYGVQDFLDVDARFGTKEDLKQFVRAAHEQGIYVLLDIILNHAGDVFKYRDNNPVYTGKTFDVEGFWNAHRDTKSLLPFRRVDEEAHPESYPHGAIWPAELQDPDMFIRKGCIGDWEAFPEYVEGDFFSLKCLSLGPSEVHNFAPGPALDVLCEIFKFWIAYADIDGFRIDTVKHMGDGPTRYFASAIHEFAKSIGKENFLLAGEISGDKAFQTVSRTTLDAALGIGPIQKALWCVPRGRLDPRLWFQAFLDGRSLSKPQRQKAGDRWARNQIIIMIDDHDQIWREDYKERFCATAEGSRFLTVAIGLNLCSLGIPCIYYGTEQQFDGCSERFIGHSADHSDRFLREAMFGGDFGAFCSRNRHFFDESSDAYRLVQDLSRLRKEEIALRRGSQNLCEISSGSRFFCFSRSQRCPVFAWARTYEETEIICVVNTDRKKSLTVWISLHMKRQRKECFLDCLYPPNSAKVPITRTITGRQAVWLTVPPASFSVYK